MHLYTNENVVIANHCEGMAGNFMTTGYQLFVKKSTSVTLVCKTQSSYVFWAYLDTIEILGAKSPSVTTADGAVTFYSDGATAGGKCLTTKATIPNVNALIGTTLSCLADNYVTPTSNYTVVFKYTGEPTLLSTYALSVTHISKL